MQLSVMSTAKRYREFIADFQANCSWLCEPEMMRITRFTTANQAMLRGNKLQMCFVTQPFRFGNGKLAFIDSG